MAPFLALPDVTNTAGRLGGPTVVPPDATGNSLPAERRANPGLTKLTRPRKVREKLQSWLNV
jgi:hypothetical protein